LPTEEVKKLIVSVITQELDKVRYFAISNGHLTEVEWNECLQGALMVQKGKGEDKNGNKG
jgi:hypothetical protein